LNKTSRRRLLGGLAAGAAGVVAGLVVRRKRSHGPAVESAPIGQPAQSLEPRALLVDAILPRGSALPGALESGVDDYLTATLSRKEFVGVNALIREGLDRLRAAATAQGADWAALDAPGRVRLLSDAVASDEAFAWEAFRDALLDFVLEGHFGHPARGGNRGGRTWTGAGVTLPEGSTAAGASDTDLFRPARKRVSAQRLVEASRQRWDAIIVGSGAGGGAAAWRLSARGLRVLVLEKGPRLPQRALIPDEIGSCLRDAFVPFTSDDPHVLVERGVARRSHEGWTSSCVGGGTVHMSAMLYRMHDEDFDAKTRFGAPNGSTLIDWPFGYETLRPYYDEVQAHLGLSGETGRNPFDPKGAPYPSAPLATHPSAEAVDRAATAAGLHPFPTPRGILTAGHAGRRPCIQCGYWGSYACPVGAKASSADAFFPEAEATGRCTVLPGAAVVRVTEEAGRARGVIVVDEDGGLHELRAPWIVLAASAVESARLLLVSESPRFPHGLGNVTGQVGKNLVFSLEAAGRAAFDYPSILFPREHDGKSFINRSIQDRYVDRDAPGGYPKVGTLVIERTHANPIQRARRAARHPTVVLGKELATRLEASLRDSRDILYESFVEMVPRNGVFVSLAPDVRGAEGQPAARIAIDDAPFEAERAARLADLARRILEPLRPRAFSEDAALRCTTFLQAGTCRMGRREESSVCDERGRVRGVRGLVVADGSALPSMGGVPPTLTIMANAVRIADLVLRDR
jgi:choline dehydrogenase-like flavoprotein